MSAADGDDATSGMTEQSQQPPPFVLQRLRPALRLFLVFVVGALFGAVCTFFFVFLKLPAVRPIAGPNPSQTPISIPTQVTPPSSSDGSESAESSNAPAASTYGAVENVPANDAVTALPGASTVTSSDVTPTQRLLIPVEGIHREQLADTFDDARSQGRRHDAIDIMAPRGTRVLAAVDGTVVKLFNSERGGLTLYEFGLDQRFVYYYAHLAGYAPGIVEGAQVRQGDLIGYVGSTGDASADAPHLHFEVSVLGPEKHWWRSTAVNPYPVLTRP